MVQRVCQFCKESFSTRNKKQSFCSNSCKNRARASLLEVTCPWCKKTILVKRKGTYTKRFCSNKCVCAWREQLPGMKEHHHIAGKKGVTNHLLWRKAHPEIVQKMKEASSIRMKENNPSTRVDVVKKIMQTKKERGILHVWAGVRGGNGHFTEAQKLLAHSLGWQMELPVSLGKRRPGYPTCYKVDVGENKLKIAIEVDGKTHRWKKTMLKDAKKEKALQSLGWKVLRFTNQEIMNNLSMVLSRIKKECKDM